MSGRCPDGHESAATDFCDICGMPMPSGPAVSASAVPPPGAARTGGGGALPTAGATTEYCGNCGVRRAPGARFCEDCGYDFSTHELPPPPQPFDPAAFPPPAAARSATPSPAAGHPTTGPGQGAPPPLSQWQPSRSQSSQWQAAPSPHQPPPAAPSPPVQYQATPPTAAASAWVAEIWVDADWFAAQDTFGACPTSGAPLIIPLTSATALIGRHSRSRGLTPEIDCSSDVAISHSHAELTFAGGRWSVRDLGSTNGTYVGRADGRVPNAPLPALRPHELADDERVYVGTWTRIVVRPAGRSEITG